MRGKEHFYNGHPCLSTRNIQRSNHLRGEFRDKNPANDLFISFNVNLLEATQRWEKVLEV